MESFVMILTVFVLALFVGWEVITKVPPTLHTPLMSGFNAISGITIIGAILSMLSGGLFGISLLLGLIGLILIAIGHDTFSPMMTAPQRTY